MSTFGRWCLWIGLGLIAVAVLARVLDLISVTVIVAIFGLLGVGMAGYDWLYYTTQRAAQRREAAKREREQGR
jgi:5-bromo-4-chloroindolyl phosphate hydrolysis protein